MLQVFEVRNLLARNLHIDETKRSKYRISVKTAYRIFHRLLYLQFNSNKSIEQKLPDD